MQDLYEDDSYSEDMAMYQSLLRDLALNVILLDNQEAEKSLFDFLQMVGDFELLGEMTSLAMTRATLAMPEGNA
jgi:hypothetical protein